MSELINTGRFDFDKAYASAAWMDAMEHPEEHEDPEVLEYEITTFVYRRRQPFDLDKLNQFVGYDLYELHVHELQSYQNRSIELFHQLKGIQLLLQIPHQLLLPF